MLGRRQSGSRLDDGGRDAEPDVDLGELAAGRPAAEDEQAGRQLAGKRRVAVRPDRDGIDAVDGWSLRGRCRPRRRRSWRSARGRRRRGGPRPARDPRSCPFPDRRRRRLRRAHRTWDESSGSAAPAGRLTMKSRAFDAAASRTWPGWRGAGRAGEERLRGQAADVRAAAAEPAPVDDRDRRAKLARLERGRLAGRSGPDDHEIERVHGHPLVVPTGSPRWRRAS